MTFFIIRSVLFVKKGFSVLIGSVYHACTCMRNKMSVSIIDICLHHWHIQYPRKVILLLGSLMFGVIGLKFRTDHAEYSIFSTASLMLLWDSTQLTWKRHLLQIYPDPCEILQKINELPLNATAYYRVSQSPLIILRDKSHITPHPPLPSKAVLVLVFLLQLNTLLN